VEFESIPLRPLILVVEDNEDDVLLIRRAFERAMTDNPLHILRSGSEAIEYLNGDPPYEDRTQHPLPAMVLLDIKLPQTDGFEVLRWIRSRTDLAPLSVVMLTSSDHIRDVNLAYQLGANSFLVKPLDFCNAAELSRSIRRLLGSSFEPTALSRAAGWQGRNSPF
jgi:CheY-like chemotaxis protein